MNRYQGQLNRRRYPRAPQESFQFSPISNSSKISMLILGLISGMVIAAAAKKFYSAQNLETVAEFRLASEKLEKSFKRFKDDSISNFSLRKPQALSDRVEVISTTVMSSCNSRVGATDSRSALISLAK